MPETAVPRQNQPLFDEDPAKWMDWMLTQNPSYQVPQAYELHNGSVRKKPEPLINKIGKYAPYVGFAAAGGLGAASALSGGGAVTASGGFSPAAGGFSAAGGGGSAAGTAASAAGASGMNWMDLADLGTNFLGGLLQKGPQKRKSYDQYHDGVTNPHDSLFGALNAILRLGSGLDDQVKKGVTLRSQAPAPPKPVSIPGLGFQIGGGMGADPANADPSQLHYDGPETFAPFNGYGQNLFNGASNEPKKPSGARKRNP
jgi:hypothetical protein